MKKVTVRVYSKLGNLLAKKNYKKSFTLETNIFEWRSVPEKNELPE